MRTSSNSFNQDMFNSLSVFDPEAPQSYYDSTQHGLEPFANSQPLDYSSTSIQSPYMSGYSNAHLYQNYNYQSPYYHGNSMNHPYSSDQPLDLTMKKLEEFERLNESASPTGSETTQYSTEDSHSESEAKNGWLEKIRTGTRSRVRSPKSWEFLLRLLLDPNSNPRMIKWEDKEEGSFRLVMKEEIARIWGMRTEKHKKMGLSYDNFARNLRYHYRTKMMEPVSEKHLVYKFGDKIMESIRNGEIPV